MVRVSQVSLICFPGYVNCKSVPGFSHVAFHVMLMVRVSLVSLICFPCYDNGKSFPGFSHLQSRLC